MKIAAPQELALWPGVARVDVQYNDSSVSNPDLEVTAFGDAEPKYISAGPPSCTMTIECDGEAMRRLIAVLSSPPPPNDRELAPSPELAIRPVRYMTLED